MEAGVGSGSSHEKAGFLARAWDRIKAQFSALKSNVSEFHKKVKKVGRDDPRRIVHSIKVGLALSLVSAFYYFRPLYQGFGVSAMWAVLTVVVVFEYTVGEYIAQLSNTGATLGKGLNRAFATLTAGALAIGVHKLASFCGERGEPIILSASVFFLAGVATFARFFPQIKARYDYGAVIFILTFSLVAVSGYRVDELIQLAHQRLSTIVIGSFACVFISIFVSPVWAGEELQKLIAQNIEKLALFLEGFESEYFKEEGESGVSKEDKSFLQGYKGVLNAKASEESLANFARWEPCHGRFMFYHPWKQYLKIGSLARQCAYSVDSLHACIASETEVELQDPFPPISHSEMQLGPSAPKEFRQKIQAACVKMSSESGRALSELATALGTMTQPTSAADHVAAAKTAAANFRNSLKLELMAVEEDLLQILPALNVASLLTEVVAHAENLKEAIDELARMAKFKNPAALVLQPERTPSLARAAIKVKPVLSDADVDGPYVVIDVVHGSRAPQEINAANSHEITRIERGGL
ncbi:hypothetical protein ACLOJK_006046 [Asimina triloba]